MEDPEIIEVFPDDARSGKYEWDKWLDGKIRRLRKGEHYTIKTASMRAVASAAAKKKPGKRLRSQVDKDPDGTEVLIIQLVDK